MRKVFLWSDRWWSVLKQVLIESLNESWIVFEDIWEELDYPDIAKEVCKNVIDQQWYWILICWTGIGMSIAANKIKWIRAALVHNCYDATMSRKHNDANVICMWWRVIWPEIAKINMEKFLSCEFEWGRHERRVAKFED